MDIFKALSQLAVVRRYRQRKGRSFPFWVKIAYFRNLLRHSVIKSWAGGYVRCETGDLFYLPRHVDAQVYHRLLRPYGYPEILSNLCRLGDVVIDVGANLGEWTVPMSRLVGDKGLVFAFEPIPEMTLALRKTVGINRLGNVSVVGSALGGQSGSSTFYIDLDHSGGSGLSRSGKNVKQITVSTFRLDDFFSGDKISSCSLLKIDVEGAERAVLEGGVLFLSKFKPVIIFETGNEGETDRGFIRDILSDLGYGLVGIDVCGGVVEISWDDFIFKKGVLKEKSGVNVIAMQGVLS